MTPEEHDVRVDDRVRVSTRLFDRLTDLQKERLLKICEHPNPEHATWLRHRKGREPKLTVKTWRAEKDGSVSFPRGRLDEVRFELSKSVDRFSISTCGTTLVPVQKRDWFGPPAWSFQEHLVSELEEAFASDPAWPHSRIWRAPPGSGKTDCILRLFARLGQRMLVIVPKDSVFTQWVERVRQKLGIEPGIFKGKLKELEADIVVGSQRTVHNNLELLKGRFGVVVGDEAQTFGAATFNEVVDRCDARVRVAVSGDERRSDGCEFMIYDQFGLDLAEVDREHLIETGTLVDVKVRIAITGFRDAVYADPPRKPKEDPHAYGRRLARHRFKERSGMIARLARDPERNRLVAELARRCREEDGEQVAVLCQRREQCLLLEAELAKRFRVARLMGEDKDFEQERARFASGECEAAVGTYGKVGVGFESHRALARGVLASPVVSQPKGRMQFDQFRGRFARSAPGKPHAVVWYPLDLDVFGFKPAELLLRWCDDVSIEVGGRLVSAASWLRDAKKDARRKSATPSPDPEQPGLFDRPDPPIGAAAGAERPKWGGRRR